MALADTMNRRNFLSAAAGFVGASLAPLGWWREGPAKTVFVEEVGRTVHHTHLFPNGDWNARYIQRKEDGKIVGYRCEMACEWMDWKVCDVTDTRGVSREAVIEGFNSLPPSGDITFWREPRK